MNPVTTAWISLIIAGFFELIWTIGMKYSDGFTRLIPTIISVVGMLGSFIFLMYAVKHIPIGTAYAVWVGIGVIGIALFGIVWLNEPATIVRLMCIFLILIGVIGLRLSGTSTT